MVNDIIYDMNKQKIEKCHLCDNPGEYWDWKNGMLTSVCKFHISLEVSS
jgi:hypothetical protein